MEQLYLQENKLITLAERLYSNAVEDLGNKALVYGLEFVKYETENGVSYNIEKPKDMSPEDFETEIISLGVDFNHENPLGSYILEMIHGQAYLEDFSTDYSQIEDKDEGKLDSLVDKSVLKKTETGNYELTPKGSVEIIKDRDLKDYLSEVPGVVPKRKGKKLAALGLTLAAALAAGCFGPDEELSYDSDKKIFNYTFEGEIERFGIGEYNDSLIVYMEDDHEFEFFDIDGMKMNGVHTDIWTAHETLTERCEPIKTFSDGYCQAEIQVEGAKALELEILETAEENAVGWGPGLSGLLAAGAAAGLAPDFIIAGIRGGDPYSVKGLKKLGSLVKKLKFW